MQTMIGNVRFNADFSEESPLSFPYNTWRILADIAEKCGGDRLKAENMAIDSRDPEVLFHFADARRNLLRFYDFDYDGTLLEIGSGCGALTGLFCESCAGVTTVDPSLRKCTISAKVNDFDNLQIYAGPADRVLPAIRNADPEERFDYVTLIGALEKAGSLLSAHSSRGEKDPGAPAARLSPAERLLRLAADQLAPGGTLIIAEANRYGLKYWAGAPDDASRIPFAGIEGYAGSGGSDVQKGDRLYSRPALIRMLNEAGFTDLSFYYPVPDLWYPTEVFSEEYLPAAGSLSGNAPSYRKERFVTFSEELAASSLLQDGMFQDFANAFLIFAKH